ncbi:MAG: alpha/beta hydrolase [Candidatus Kapaibacterium sp.]
MKKLLLFLTISFVFIGCNKKDEIVDPVIKNGKNEFTTIVDDVEREYIVSIPESYDGKSDVPVVFMLHGTGGDGERFYNTSGWKELGEKENFISVFPSSMNYCILDEDGQKKITKWNSIPFCSFEYCSNVTPPDDIKFLRQIIDELGKEYTIDSKRIYFVGFSNGGQMCVKLSILMGDKIAAIVESGALFDLDTMSNPVRKLPILFQIGNGDYGPANTGPFIPLSEFDKVLSSAEYQPYKIVQTHIKSFDLNPNYTISGDTNTVVYATFVPNDGNTTNNFNFAYIKDLTHQYPNGKNHWMIGAQVNWNWLKQFTLPN